MTIKITKIEGKCQFDGCERKATHIACERELRREVGVFCEEHAITVASRTGPEYDVICPSCG